MSNETQLLTALMAAAMGQTLEPRSARTGGTWDEFLTVLCEITHADTAQMNLIESDRVTRHWRAGEDWEDLDFSESRQMRTGRVYSQFDLPAALGGETVSSPLRAIRWRIGSDAWGVILLRRSGEDFRAIDGQHLSNLQPYLAPGVQGWQRLDRERSQAALEHQICTDLGAGWILFAASGQVTSVSSGLLEKLEALMGLRVSAEGWLMLPSDAAGALRDALSALANDRTGQHILWLSTVPQVQMVVSVEECAGVPELVGRVRYDISAGHLPLSWVMAAFGLNRSEARLAVALCKGLSLAEAAAHLGWTLETTRSNSKRLFARMGVSGQADVVRTLLTSAVWLRPPGVRPDGP